MAEKLVTFAGSYLFANAAYTDEMVDDALSRFDRIFAHGSIKAG